MTYYGLAEEVIIMPKCRKCGADIRWIMTKGGKKMPCDITPVLYRKGKINKDRLVLNNGEVISCEITQNSDDATGYGFMPHWATCNGGEK